MFDSTNKKAIWKTQHLNENGACGSLCFRIRTSSVERALPLDRGPVIECDMYKIVIVCLNVYISHIYYHIFTLRQNLKDWTCLFFSQLENLLFNNRIVHITWHLIWISSLEMRRRWVDMFCKGEISKINQVNYTSNIIEDHPW